MYYWSRWPRILRYGVADARLLGLRDRIPPGRVCLSFVNAVCCQAEVSAAGRSLVQRIPTEGRVSGFDIENSTMRKPKPTRTVKFYTLLSFVLSLYPIRKILEYYPFIFINTCHIHTFWRHHNPSISTGFIYRPTFIISSEEVRLG
jgi:hypothetical protein